MGIVNVTPDSFYDGGINNTEKKSLLLIEKHLNDGATFIDIGGYSSRPGAINISTKEEIDRVTPIIEAAVLRFPDINISIDTFRSEVARTAIESGAKIINDISGGELDTEMFHTVAELKTPYILMHMNGNPENMQLSPSYNNVLIEIGLYFSTKLKTLRSLGVSDVILDVGFGFGKTIDHNYQLLSNLKHFEFLGAPMLAGLSRKSMLYKPLNGTPEDSLNATTCANMIALMNGAKILRVHDVKEASEAISIYQLTKKQYNGN